MKSLNESFVPKAVLKPSLEINSIQKYLLILYKKFKFQTTQKINYKHFWCLKQSLKALLEIKFPMLISVENKFATYHYVVVVWREMVIDYKSMYTYLLTEDHWGKYAVLILPFKESAVGMASYRQQFAKHLRQIRIFRTGTQKNIANKGAQ